VLCVCGVFEDQGVVLSLERAQYSRPHNRAAVPVIIQGFTEAQTFLLDIGLIATILRL